MLDFVKMTDSDFRELKDFAAPIWRECYKGVVEAAHTEALISKYFEYENIKKYAANGMVYEYIYFENEKAGFTAYELYPEYLYLDKLYLQREYRGKGISKGVFAYLAEAYGLNIRLNVNRGNKTAIAAYAANGFKVIKAEEIPQKGGFVNIDYVMEKTIKM